MKVSRVHRDFFNTLLTQLKEAGVSQAQLFKTLRSRGVRYSSKGPSVFAGVEGMSVLETAVELTKDPCLAIRLGQKVDMASYGSFGFALMSCANMRESIALLCRYGQAMFEPRWTAIEHGDGLLLRLNISVGSELGRQIVTELSFSNLSTLGNSLYRKPVDGTEVQFNFSRPAHVKCYGHTFDGPITFDCEHSQVFLPARVLDTPVKTANRSRHVVFYQQCEEMLRGLNSAESTTSAVRQLLIQSAGDFLDIAQVAQSLNVSERTLRRRLDAESTSFRAVVEEVRDLLAREYLAGTELTVAEIAHLLDYSETANFRRAFIRWNGVTPSQYREQHVA